MLPRWLSDHPLPSSHAERPRLGLKVAFVGVCGDDVFGRFMLDKMQLRDVDVSHVIVHPGGQTGLSVILNRETDRAILTHPGLMADLRGADISEALLAPDTPFARCILFPANQTSAGSAGFVSTCSPTRPDHLARHNHDPSEMWTGFDELLSATDVFLPNKTEALSIIQSKDVQFAATQLARKAN